MEDTITLIILTFHFYFLTVHCNQQNSVNASVPKIPYPWLVFNDKVKVNSVFLRDSTGVPDSVLLLFGGNILRGGLVSLVPLVLVSLGVICSLIEDAIMLSIHSYGAIIFTEINSGF